MTSRVEPRLIRPTKDGQEGEWSYLLHANGEDYIFPAQVDELGQLRELFDEDKPKRKPSDTSVPTDPRYARKVIYWKASEWESKLLPHAVSWMNEHRYELPPLPYPVMELRKIEDRDGEDRVTEVLSYAAVEASEDCPVPTAMFWNFKEVDDQEGDDRRPLLQWWMEGAVEFLGNDLDYRGYSVPRFSAKLAEFGQFPELTKRIIDEKGTKSAFQMFAVKGSRTKDIRQDELRVVVVFVAFCRYIASLKTTYEEGLPTRGRRRSEARTTEEALALEQAEIFKTVGVLKSGLRKKPIATGTGTPHRYRYLVRGHERIVNGKSIWIKPQVRGQGEFLARSIGTDEAVESAREIEPPAVVSVPQEQPAEPQKVSLPVPDEQPNTMDGDSVPEEIAAESERPEPVTVVRPRRSIVHTVLSFFRSLFR